MKIVIITPYFAPAWAYGGPPKVLYNLAKALKQLGNKVTIITTDVFNERRNPILRENLEGIDVYRYKTLSNKLSFKFKVFIVPGILRKTRNIFEDTDVVLFSDLRTVLNWQFYRYLLEKQIPYGIFPFGQIPYDKGIKAEIKKIFDLWWVKDFVKNATYRFAQTRHEQEMFGEFFNIPLEETQLLLLPMKIERHRQDANRLSGFKKKFVIFDKDKILLFIGRLHYLKGIDLLIRAVVPLFKKDSNLKLMIVGRDDGVEQSLKAMIPKDTTKRIIFTGPLYNEETFYAYKTATCFVMTPRYYEETSVASLEALSLGIPVIVTKQADIPFLEKYDAGFVIENTSGTIQRAIYALLEKVRTDKTRIQNQTIKLINDHYRSEIVAQNLLDYLKQRRLK